MQRDVAIVGGGRWGRVILSVLATANLPVKHITLVTQHNAAAAQQAVQQLSTKIPITITARLEDLQSAPALAIIANAARDHVATARALLARGSHLLIEKPVVLSVKEAQQLQTLADKMGKVLLPGLTFRFASYLQHFAQHVVVLESSPTIEIHWSDAAGELRHGEQKNFDASINVAADVMPHIWTLLSVLLPVVAFKPVACTSSREGKKAVFTIAGDGIIGHVTLERESDQRRRIVRFTTDKKESLTLDFTTEPGTITVNGKTSPGDDQWATSPRPLAQQLHYFFECVKHGNATPADRQALLDSVAFAETASALLEKSL